MRRFLCPSGDDRASRAIILVEGHLVDDADLVGRAQQGDSAAFGELVKRHERAMLAIARSYFASDADARDAAQAAFLKAWRHLGRIRKPARFAAWLTRITARTCLDVLRTRPDRVSLAEFSSSVRLRPRVGTESLTPASLAGKREEAIYVKAAIGRLREHQRVVLMLRYAEDMSYADMAQYLSVRISTVRGRLEKAKKAMRRELALLSPEHPSA